MLLAGVEVERLPRGAFRWLCPPHGMMVSAFLSPAGPWKVWATCKICDRATLQPVLDALEAWKNNGDSEAAGREQTAEDAPPGADAGNAKRSHSRRAEGNGRAQEGNDDFLRRVPPHSEDAEKAVLGAIFLEDEAIGRIPWLTIEMFYREVHREIFKAIRTLRDNAQPIDIVTLRATLERAGKWGFVSPQYLAEIISFVPGASAIEHYAAIVRDMHIKRGVGTFANELVALAYKGVSADALVGHMHSAVARFELLAPAKPQETEPIPLDDPDLPGLPRNLFAAWADDFIEALSVATETPRELSALMVLGAVATATQRKFEVAVQPGYSEPMNIWAAAALEPGNRKTAVIIASTKPLLSWAREQAASIETAAKQQQSKLDTAKARINELRQQAAKAKPDKYKELEQEIVQLESELPTVDRVPRLWTQDVTPERLGALMADNGEKMSLISDEGGIFEILGGRYSKGVPNLDLFLQSHSGAPVSVDRGSRPSVVMERPALTMIMSPQPDVLIGLAAKKEFRGRGLLARFLYALPQSPLGRRTGDTRSISDAIAEAYNTGLRKLLDCEPKEQPAMISLTREAYDEWFAFWKTVEREMGDGERFEQIRDWGGKLPGMALRIAGNMHCVEHAFDGPGDHQLDLKTMRSALKLSAVLSRHALAVFDLMGSQDSLKAGRKLWNWIVRNGQPTFSFRDAFQALRGTFQRVEDLEPAVEVLVERFYIREIVLPRQGPGRPSRQFEVNPALIKREVPS